jgi:hypothetical protein
LLFRKQLEDELDEYVRKNIQFGINGQESGKYMHNQVKKPYFTPITLSQILAD